ncbi:MAG: putative rane protein [Blastococcus sp.]|jgi:uncharacterized membrane protein YozB (DUF420 family)|nr:putative rane protein [Blastococcus sp.]
MTAQRRSVVDEQPRGVQMSAVSSNARARPQRSRGTWLVPVALIALSVVPIIAGSLRLVELSGGAAILPAKPTSPLPLVLHIASASIYSVLGAFQFSAGLRRRRPGWHRTAGRGLVVIGLVVALAALWLTVSTPRFEGSGDLYYVLRLVFGSAMVISLVLGFLAIRRRDVARHRVWMIRAYAIALAAGAQVFTLGIGEAIVGKGDTSSALFAGAGWLINLTVAEWVIRRRQTPRERRVPAID